MKSSFCTTAIISFAILAVSCQKEKRYNITKTSADQEFAAHVAQFANYHDDGLEYIYNKIISTWFGKTVKGNLINADIFYPPNPNDPSLPSDPSIPFPVKNYTYEYMKTALNINMDSLATINPAIIEQDMDTLAHLFDHNRYWMSDYFKYVYHTTFSSRLTTALNNYQLVLENNDDTIIIKTQGRNIVNASLLYISDTLEKVLLITMVEVGINSAGYWQRNFTKWQELADAYYGSTARGPGGPNWKEIIWTDIVGAGVGTVKGAVGGFIGGSVTIPGIGSVGGVAVGGLAGMLGGAIGTSATATFWNYFQLWIDWSTIPITDDNWKVVRDKISNDPYLKLLIQERNFTPLEP